MPCINIVFVQVMEDEEEDIHPETVVSYPAHSALDEEV
jgi:hypothetical protein